MNSSILALDIGERRIGVAIADSTARIARPLTTLEQGGDVFGGIANLIREHGAMALVAGLPRGLDGQHTAQAAYTETFVHKLKQHITIPVYWQDEAVTSRQAERELQERGKPYTKGDIDALAATYILEDFLAAAPHGKLGDV